MGTLQTEFRASMRSLLRSPGFLFSVVLCLGLGLGLNLGVMYLMDNLVLRPFPVHKPRDLALVLPRNAATGDVGGPLTMADFLDLKDQVRSLEMAACTSRNRTLEGLKEPLQVNVGILTANYLRMFGTRPALGRVEFTRPEEDAPHAEVAVIRHDFWLERMGADPNIIGRTLVLDGRPIQVVGVLAKECRFLGRLTTSQIFLPEAISYVGRTNRGVGTFEVLGRLQPGASLKAADAEVHLAATRISLATGQKAFDATARSAVEEFGQGARSLLVMLQVAVALVLLVACFNIASLQLVRNTSRTRELAIRRSLGAGAWQMWRACLMECLIIGLGGTLAGLALSLLLQRMLAVVIETVTGIKLMAGLYPSLACLGLILGLGAGLMLALLSGWMLPRSEFGLLLREGTKGTFSRTQRWMLKTMVVLELALSVALLLGSGLLVRSMINRARVSPGFQTAHRLVVHVPLSARTYPDTPNMARFLDRAEPALREIPGVEAVGLNDMAPMIRVSNTTDLGSSANMTPRENAWVHDVNGAYFQTMGIPLLEGQPFTRPELDACVISRHLARRLWPNQSAVGRNLFLGGDSKAKRVVGVVEDTLINQIGEDPHGQIYLPAHHCGLFEGVYFTLKVRGEPELYVGKVKETLRKIDAALAIPEAQSYARFLFKASMLMRAFATTFLVFGTTALLLAAFGLFSVISQITQQRRREIGIRMALGAWPLKIAGEIMQETLLLCGAGLAMGSGLGWALARILENQLFGIRKPTLDLYLGALLILGLTALIASLLPALRAALLDPARALKED